VIAPARQLACVAALLLLAPAAWAQAGRHELGLRLRAFERRLAAVEDAARRDDAFGHLERAVQAFFRMDTASVAAAIDAADLALAGRTATAVERYARSLELRLARRLVSVGDASVSADVRALYDADDVDAPAGGLTIAVQAAPGAGWQRVSLASAEAGFEVDLDGLPTGDHTLRWQVERDGAVLASRSMTLSAATGLDERLAAVLLQGKAARALKARSIESETLPALANLLRTTQRRRAYETDLRGRALLEEAERVAGWLERGAEGVSEGARYGGGRAGAFRLHVPVGDRVVAVRFEAPEVEDGLRPLVVALHGAGGSENLFFDGYGDGLCVQLARERGWFVVSPRISLRGVDCAGLVDALSARYPVDPSRVFVVGHSMGAAQLMSNVARSPERFCAAAPIAGGGRVGGGAGFARLPFFVGAGARDFGRSGARRLHAAIEAAGAEAVWRLYPSVEHLAVMQVALPDVFAFFDGYAR
jgi:predicted esterase